MSTVRVYRSTDTGAPAHPSAIRGSMAALLRACLVTGYDVQLPAGWEEPFVETNNYACFRAVKAGAKFFQVNDNVDPDVTEMTMFDSMSDAETGTGSNGSNFFGKYVGGKPTDWFVVADENTCIVLLHGGQYGWGYEAFGEYYSYLASDPSKYFLMGHHTATSYNMMVTSSFTRPTSLATSVTSGHIALSSGVFTTSPMYGKCILVSNRVENYTNLTSHLAAYDPSIAYTVFPVKFFASSEGAVRGELRGTYIPEAQRPYTSGTTFTNNGKTYLAIDINDNYSSVWQIFIDITGSWEESV